MKILFRTSLIFSLFLLAFVSKSFAQQWSAEQKDVWSGVEKYWSVDASGDAKGFISYFDESYMGWAYQSDVPQTKSNTSKWIENGHKNTTTVLYTLTPLAIWVKGDFAYADYYYAQIEKNNESGKEERSEGKWTDILMKKDGKWLLIGDHGGRTSKPNSN